MAENILIRVSVHDKFSSQGWRNILTWRESPVPTAGSGREPLAARSTSGPTAGSGDARGHR